MKRLWCRLVGHRWGPHHDVPGLGRAIVIGYCPRCGSSRVTPDGDAAASWRERRL